MKKMFSRFLFIFSLGFYLFVAKTSFAADGTNLVAKLQQSNLNTFSVFSGHGHHHHHCDDCEEDEDQDCGCKKSHKHHAAKKKKVCPKKDKDNLYHNKDEKCDCNEYH